MCRLGALVHCVHDARCDLRFTLSDDDDGGELQVLVAIVVVSRVLVFLERVWLCHDVASVRLAGESLIKRNMMEPGGDCFLIRSR